MCNTDLYTIVIIGSTDIGLNCDGKLADENLGIYLHRCDVGLLLLIRGVASCNAMVDQFGDA